MDQRNQAKSGQPNDSPSAAPDGGIVALYAQRLAAFRRRAPVRRPEPPRVIPFGRGAADAQPPRDAEPAPPHP